jgi:hypothetical protein
MQHFLKAFVRSAWARIVSAELFDQLFVSMDDANAALYMRFRRESAATFTRALESRADRRIDRVDGARDTSTSF